MELVPRLSTGTCPLVCATDEVCVRVVRLTFTAFDDFCDSR